MSAPNSDVVGGKEEGEGKQVSADRVRVEARPPG